MNETSRSVVIERNSNVEWRRFYFDNDPVLFANQTYTMTFYSEGYGAGCNYSNVQFPNGSSAQDARRRLLADTVSIADFQATEQPNSWYVCGCNWQVAKCRVTWHEQHAGQKRGWLG